MVRSGRRLQHCWLENTSIILCKTLQAGDVFFCLLPDSDIDDIVHSLGSLNVLVEMFNDSDYVSAAPHSAGLNVFDLESRQVRQTNRQTCLVISQSSWPGAGFVALSWKAGSGWAWWGWCWLFTWGDRVEISSLLFVWTFGDHSMYWGSGLFSIRRSNF